MYITLSCRYFVYYYFILFPLFFVVVAFPLQFSFVIRILFVSFFCVCFCWMIPNVFRKSNFTFEILLPGEWKEISNKTHSNRWRLEFVRISKETKSRPLVAFELTYFYYYNFFFFRMCSFFLHLWLLFWFVFAFCIIDINPSYRFSTGSGLDR